MRGLVKAHDSDDLTCAKHGKALTRQSSTTLWASSRSCGKVLSLNGTWGTMEPLVPPMPAYAHGAVPVTHDPTLLSKLADLSSEFPIADFHMRLFRQLGCAFVYASRTTPAYSASESTWLVLIRFGQSLVRFRIHSRNPSNIQSLWGPTDQDD